MPEGFEDVSLEGEESLHVQVKSRAAHLGWFPVSDAARHILDAWEQHVDRGEADSRLVVVLERGAKGETPASDLFGLLAESLTNGSSLLHSLRANGNNRGVDIGALLSSTVVVGISWDDVIGETAACVGDRSDLPPAALRLLAHQLCSFFAAAVDHNANCTYEERRRLDRTEIAGEIERLTGMIDVESLEAAISEGVCETLDYGGGEATAGGDRFYEGVATQPFHVASGLVVHRPDVMEQVLSGLDERYAVVITGPSGVGKSAVLWAIPRERQGVVWFRVKRLSAGDVPAIVRLARAYSVSPQVPVGFLVDSAGTEDFTGWAHLRAEAATVPGMLLVATARAEDLRALGRLAECATVAVRLDEHAADTIHGGLARRGVTEEDHWQEAFEQSGGLTLEFVHLLTRGQRLRDVIDDQVSRRIEEQRHSELEVLALVAAADRWSAAVSTADIAQACGLSDFELREALERLNAEHLVVERDGQIGGMHRLRSTAICEAIHDVPPPTIDETIARLIPIVPVSQLHRFLATTLVDCPESRSIVIDTARGEALDLERLAATIRGLRIADFHEQAQAWNEIAEQYSVPLAVRSALFAYAAGRAEPSGVHSTSFREAWRAIVTVSDLDSRGSVVTDVGRGELARRLVSASDARRATQLLAVLAGCGPEFAESVAEAASDGSPLASALRDAPLEALSDCLGAAYSADPNLALVLVETIGSEEAVIRRIRVDNPWITTLEVHSGDNGPVGFARYLHAADGFQPDPDEHAHSLGRTMLRCLPRIESVDIRALLPGGSELVVNGYAFGASQRSRDQRRATSGDTWNQERLRTAVALIGEPLTTRLASALPLLDETAELVHQIGTALSTTRHPGADFDQRLAALHESGRNLPPPVRSLQVGATTVLNQNTVELRDALAGTIISITGNVIPRLAERSEYRALAAHIAGTVIDTNIPAAINEPWRLIGIEDHPPSLDRLRADLEDLCAVVGELAHDDADTARLQRAGRDGRPSRPLERVAEFCRTAEKRRQQQRRAEVQSACSATGLRARVFDTAYEPGATEYRVSVGLDSLHDWYHAVGTLEAALRPNRPPGETYLLVPLRYDRPVPSLAMRLINNVHHDPNPAGLDRLPQPHSGELAAIFDEANHALQCLSGICELPADQQAHETVHAATEEIVARTKAACEQLRGLPDDPVTAALLSLIGDLATRVQAEHDGTSTEPGFAAQVTRALLGESTDESVLITNARCLALEWDIDPQAAAEQLVEADG